ncbi:GntR family transcriptional regulator [Leisingera caerulea]|jgi:GntR family histidine utilization transcriptional repressor|uniref:GntR family transcriptional regulator n=1 Tax=Leisingera caerulea TaxID=506591 RepID=UPI0021A775A7|nr:GntR family transcriptional regulator [Leisingera caerulea]UWQ86316.1 GntR family transcriptional regulator [Leisingera caerulea]
MKTAFRDVKEDIRRRIVQGVWGPGDLLPNEVDLAEEFHCARATVNRAMRELAEEGLVERKRKAGTRVLLSPVRQARFNIPIVRKEIESRGLMYRYALVNREVIDTPDWLRARLGLEGDGQVLHLTCMHYGDGSPYQFEDRWINLAALPQAIEADFSKVGPTEWLIATVPYSDAEISFSAMTADDETARHLSCAQGDSLFLAERSTWFEDRAITYVRLVFQRGYRMTTRY